MSPRRPSHQATRQQSKRRQARRANPPDAVAAQHDLPRTVRHHQFHHVPLALVVVGERRRREHGGVQERDEKPHPVRERLKHDNDNCVKPELLSQDVKILQHQRFHACFAPFTVNSITSSSIGRSKVSVGGAAEQPSMLAIALAERLLDGNGAARVHGGGFGGTIQAFVPLDDVESFSAGMDAVFGKGACGVYGVDHKGARAQWL